MNSIRFLSVWGFKSLKGSNNAKKQEKIDVGGAFFKFNRTVTLTIDCCGRNIKYYVLKLVSVLFCTLEVNEPKQNAPLPKKWIKYLARGRFVIKMAAKIP